MSDLNTVTLEGNLTADPDYRTLDSGNSLARLGLAVNRSKKVGDDWQEEVSFFDVTVFGRLADNVSESLSKGDRVVVSGRLQQRSWENDEGEKRYAVSMIADAIAASLRFATLTVTKNAKRSAENEAVAIAAEQFAGAEF